MKKVIYIGGANNGYSQNSLKAGKVYRVEYETRDKLGNLLYYIKGEGLVLARWFQAKSISTLPLIGETVAPSAHSALSFVPNQVPTQQMAMSTQPMPVRQMSLPVQQSCPYPGFPEIINLPKKAVGIDWTAIPNAPAPPQGFNFGAIPTLSDVEPGLVCFSPEEMKADMTLNRLQFDLQSVRCSIDKMLQQVSTLTGCSTQW